MLPIPTWAKGLDTVDVSSVNPSFAPQFILLQVQKLLKNSGLFKPELERLLITDLNGPEVGNAFAAGRFSIHKTSDLQTLVRSSYEDFITNPSDIQKRLLLAYSLGSIAYSKVITSFSNSNNMEYLESPEKIADLDFCILKNFYVKKFTPALQNPEYIKDLFNTMTTRTYVRYHTLKCTENLPMEWLDHTIAYRERQLAHYDRIASRFAQDNANVPTSVFDPFDPALHTVSPSNNYPVIDREMLGELIAVPTRHSAVGKSIIGGVKLILDLKFTS